MQDDPFRTIHTEAKREVPDVTGDAHQEEVVQRLVAAIERQYGVLPPPEPVNGYTIRKNCRFCRGRGCLNCDTLADREYNRQFPPGQPLPFVRVDLDDPAATGSLVVFFRQITGHPLGHGEEK